MDTRTHTAIAIHPRAPFRLDLTAWALRRRALNQTDRWDGSTYRRVLVLDGTPAEVALTQESGTETPALHLTIGSSAEQQYVQSEAIASVERMLATDQDTGAFHALAQGDPTLAPLATRFRGLHPPRFPTVFECLVNAVAMQQLSLEVGLTLLNRLSATYGASCSAEDAQVSAFPEPADLAAAQPQGLRELGFSFRKANTIIGIAEAVNEGGLDLESLALQEDEHVVETLTQIAGIGRWSAEYTLLRGLGRLHVFPGDDVGARNNLAHWLGLAHKLDYAGVQDAVAGWYPYAGFVYFHLLLDRLAARGEVPA